MGFGDLKKKEGLTALNEYLADKSYIEGSVVFTKFWYDYDIMKRGGGELFYIIKMLIIIVL